jgi:acyl-coenzyme A thioesterase PaaI-like protein
MMMDEPYRPEADSRPRWSDSGTMEASRTTDLRSRHHPACFVCSPDQGHGLGLRFSVQADDSVAGTYTFGQYLEGYPGVVHGGIVAAALDGAMTHWLFMHNRSAVTAELKIRYLLPVASRVPVLIRARWIEGSGMLFVMSAEVVQSGRQMATASAKFIANASSARIAGGVHMSAVVRITCLVNDFAGATALPVEHGLSFLIEIGGKAVLFDTGQTELLLANARQLGFDLGVTGVPLASSAGTTVRRLRAKRFPP